MLCEIQILMKAGNRRAEGELERSARIDREKMREAQAKFDRMQSPAAKAKSRRAAKDLGTGSPDKVEVLREQNLRLKRHKHDLESEVQVIST